MSTRDSNRMKRFSAYGAIDTAAALAGQEEALMVAAIAQEDEEAEGPFSEEMEDEATRRGSGGFRKVKAKSVVVFLDLL